MALQAAVANALVVETLPVQTMENHFLESSMEMTGGREVPQLHLFQVMKR